MDRLLSLPVRETRYLWLDFWTAFSRRDPDNARELLTEASDVVINLLEVERWIRRRFAQDPAVRPIDAAREALIRFSLERKWEPHLHRVALKVRKNAKSQDVPP